MNKKDKETNPDKSEDIIGMGEPKQFEVWLSFWHWALPVLVGWIPEVKRFYIQILCLNIAIGFKPKCK